MPAFAFDELRKKNMLFLSALFFTQSVRSGFSTIWPNQRCLSLGLHAMRCHGDSRREQAIVMYELEGSGLCTYAKLSLATQWTS